MLLRVTVRSFTVLVLAAVWLAPAVLADLKEDISEATRGFRDLTGTVVNVYANTRELQKIDKNFGQSYEFEKAKVTFKHPDKFRMEGYLGLVRIVYITSGYNRIVRIPAINRTKRENLRDESGKAQTCLDIGIVTDGLWLYYTVKPEDTEQTDSGPVIVLHLTRSGDPRLTERIWLDGKTFKLLKREKYEEGGDLKARFIYKNHRNVGDVLWAPSRVESYSPAGVLVAATEFRDIKVNNNVADSEFR